jgi:hypothetical protein
MDGKQHLCGLSGRVRHVVKDLSTDLWFFCKEEGREWELRLFGVFFGGTWTLAGFQESSNYAGCRGALFNPG